MQGMATPHKHFDLELNLLVRGVCNYHIAGQRVVVPQGRLLALWGATPHRSHRLSDDTYLIWTTISLSNVLNWPINKHFLSSLLKKGWAVDSLSYETDEPMMRRWVCDLSEGDDAVREIVLLELQARLYRLATSAMHSNRKVGQTVSIGEHERTILSVERFISLNFREPLTIKDIAKQTDLHPNYLMSLYRKYTGITLIDSVTQHRIAFCLHELALTDTPILQISLAAGFTTSSRFYDAFSREVGCSPSEYRRRVWSERHSREPLRNSPTKIDRM